MPSIKNTGIIGHVGYDRLEEDSPRLKRYGYRAKWWKHTETCRLCTLIAVISFLSANQALNLERETCDPGRMKVDVDVANADAVIGGIFDLRLPGDDDYGCGKPHAEMILVFEAARWALQRINDRNYIPGIRLGMTAYDTCHSPSRAMQAAMDFYPQYSASTMYCNETGKLNLGILGPITSWTTKPVAEMAGHFPASQISPSASSPALSDKAKYPYFLRTGLSSSDQIETMIALMKELGWERIVLAYSMNDYGQDAITEFIRQSQNSDVCVVETIGVPPTGTPLEYGNSLDDIHRYDVNGAVYFGDHYSMANVMKALQLKNLTANIQWMVSLVNMNDDVLSGRMRGSIFVTPQFTEVTEFYDYFTTSIDEKIPPPENPWYQDWFMETFECKIRDINYLPYVGYSDCTDRTPATKRAATNTNFAFVDSTIKAVYAYARAFRNAQSALCGSTTLCPRLRQMSPSEFHGYLESVNFNMNEVGINSLQDQPVRFDGNGDFMYSAHTIWNYNNQPSGPFRYKQVGSYTTQTLTVDMSKIYMYDWNRVNVLPNLPSSPCPQEGCRNCIVPRPMVHFTFTPGDVIIAGLFDIHGMGSEVMTCGMLKQTHALEAAAFKFAMKQVKTHFGSGFLNGVELGSLIVDLCDSGETGRLLMNNILANRHVVRDKYGRVIDPYRIKSVVGTLDSTEAISMATMLGQFMMPQLEAAATSHLLSNRMHFPYFSRVVPSDNAQIQAIVMLLMRFDWRYIQVIHSGDAYGRSGAKMLRDLAAERSVCIAAKHEIGMDGDYDRIVQNFRKTPNANIVVGIMDSDDFRGILQAMKDHGVSPLEYKLIGTETWGTKRSVVSGLSDVAEGAISMDIIPPPMTRFRMWLDGLNPSNMDTMKEMPFFVEWYEHAFNCYIDANQRGIYTQQCQYNQGITQAPNYEETSYTPFIISATYAVARAIDMALKDYCGAGYNGVCWQFRTASHLKNKILGYIRDAEFNVDDFNPNSLFKIIDGEGESNFAIYSFQSGVYSQIGTYNTESRELVNIPLNVPSLDNFVSRCQSVCGECVYLLQQAPFSVFGRGDLMLGVNVAIHNPDMSGDPIRCSDMRLTNGFQTGVAIMYALNEVNSRRGPVILNNVEVGGLLFDHCNSPARAYGLPSALYSGILESRDYSPDLNTIRAWLTDNTLVTEEMKGFFKDLNLPVISPMAVSNMFLDEDEYPTFLRTVQGDSTVAAALAVLVKSLGFQYVTIVHSANSFGEGGKEAFYQIAQQEGICIIKAFELGPSTDTGALMAELVAQTTHVVVTYLGMGDMETFIDARAGNPAALDNLVVFSPEPYAALYRSKGSAARNILSLSMKANNMAGYKAYIDNVGEEAFMQHSGLTYYYQDLFQCNLPGYYRYAQDCTRPLQKITNSPNFFLDNYVLSTINAVYTFVTAAHETLKEKCGEDYSGVCADFSSDTDTNTILLKKMKEVNFVDPSDSQFYFIGQEGTASRDIQLFNGNSMTKVGEFAGASVNFFSNTFRDTFSQTKSMCVLPCSPCIQSAMNFTYIPGDVLLGGVFDVHEADIFPFSCGEINTLRGFQLLEAFHFAIQRVNDKSGMFADVMKNIRLGGIGLDACESAIKGGYLVSNIHSGLSVLQRNSHVIDPDDIDAYIGPYSSGRSIFLARLLKTLKVPQVSFGSTSVSLNDTDRYPYFLRTVPADNHQAMAMIKFLRRYNIRYVQIVHTADNYGEQGAQIFNSLAEENKICVAQTVSFSDKSVVTAESANDVILALLEKPIANTVVVFASSSFINEMLQAIRRNPEALNKFKFIGSDSWANNKEATDSVEDLAVGSVTFDLDTRDLRAFDEYLSSKTPGNYPENPWFSEYYEEIHNCYLTIPDKRYPRRCHATSIDVTTSGRYKQDTAIIHVINAVYSSAIGIDMALKEVCGVDYTTVCEAFKNIQNKRDLILHKMKDVTFTDLSGHDFSFNSHRGYTVYSIDTEAVFGYVYNPIGKYGGDGELTITAPTYRPSWDGSCNREDSCTECPTIRNLITRYMLPKRSDVEKADNPNPATLVALMNIHGQGIDQYRCGELNIHTFLRALAVKFTIEKLTDEPFGLRSLILDNCNNELRIDQDLYNLLANGQLCNAEFDPDGSQIDIDSVIGVFTLGSRFVAAANRVTAPYKIQLLSSYATSPALSDKWTYPYVARTVPPDDMEMEIIAKILKENDWSYVGVIHSDESYGIGSYKKLQDIINTGLYSCIGFDAAIPAAATVEDLRPIVRQLADVQGIGVIITLVVDPRPLLEAAVLEGVADRFVWIGTDSWGNFQSTTAGLAQHFRGAITVYFRDAIMNEFVKYVKEIDYVNRKEIPNDWFEEFYQQIHECHLPDALVIMSKYERECKLNENITTDMVLKQGVGIYDIAAAYAIGNGLDKFLSDCSNQAIIDCMQTILNPRDRLFAHTLAETWEIHKKTLLKMNGDVTTEKFNLDIGEKRYWNAGYRIYNLKHDDDNDNNYVPIGSVEDDVLTFNKDDYTSYKTVVSKCPEDQFCECAIAAGGEPQVQTTPKYMGDHEPRNYFLYDAETGKQVYTWPIWAIAVAVCTCFCLVIGILLFFYFLIFYPVRGGTTVLGFIMMLGLFGIYAINFAFFVQASAASCGIREFFMGVVYTVVFAALFVKAVDNWRFKHREYSVNNYKGISNPCTLVLITFGIILVQCIIPIEWLIVKNPSASLMTDSTAKHDWMWCDPHDFYDVSLVLSMILVIFLVILTGVFAALAWDSESNYYESRWIFVACVCTAGCFLVWMVVITNAGPPYRDPAVAIGNFMNATAILIFIPIRKLVLLVTVKSEEEKQKAVMPLDEQDREMYSTVFTNQTYEPDVFQATDSKHSGSAY